MLPIRSIYTYPRLGTGWIDGLIRSNRIDRYSQWINPSEILPQHYTGGCLCQLHLSSDTAKSHTVRPKLMRFHVKRRGSRYSRHVASALFHVKQSLYVRIAKSTLFCMISYNIRVISIVQVERVRSVLAINLHYPPFSAAQASSDSSTRSR